MELWYFFFAHRLLIFYIYTKFHEKSQRVSELLHGHETMMDGRTDRQMDKVITIGPPPTSSGGALINHAF